MAKFPLPGRGLPQAPRSVQLSQTRRVLITSIALTLALYLIPGGEIIAYPLILLSTLVHEMAHGLAALLVGGSFIELDVFSDGSGVAQTATSGDLSRAVVSAGGLVGPAVAAAIGFTIGRSARGSRIVLFVGSAATIVMALVWVRSLVGWLVVLGLVGISLGVSLGIKQDHWSQLLVVFLSVQMALSVFSRSEYLFAEGATTAAGVGRSDSASIADALFLPYWFWGALCGVFSLAVLGYGAWLFMRDTMQSRAS